MTRHSSSTHSAAGWPPVPDLRTAPAPVAGRDRASKAVTWSRGFAPGGLPFVRGPNTGSFLTAVSALGLNGLGPPSHPTLARTRVPGFARETSCRARLASRARSPLAPLPTTCHGLHGPAAASLHPPPTPPRPRALPARPYVEIGASLLTLVSGYSGQPFPLLIAAGHGSATGLRQSTPSPSDSRPLALARTSAVSASTRTPGALSSRARESVRPSLWRSPHRAGRASLGRLSRPATSAQP